MWREGHAIVPDLHVRLGPERGASAARTRGFYSQVGACGGTWAEMLSEFRRAHASSGASADGVQVKSKPAGQWLWNRCGWGPRSGFERQKGRWRSPNVSFSCKSGSNRPLERAMRSRDASRATGSARGYTRLGL